MIPSSPIINSPASYSKPPLTPQSHLNPFSRQSAPVREESTRLFAEVLNGSDARVHKDLRHELPQLLWLYHMGITLFWIHDPLPGRCRTRRLAEITVDLVVKLISVASLPPLRKATLEIMKELREAEA